MKATIKEKIEVAKGTLLVKFVVPEDINFKPGQYFTVRLIDPPYHDDRGAMRHFSIVNSPNEKGILSFATRLRESAFKKSIAEFPIGTEVEVGSISGDFILPDDTSKPLVFIAGGIGITPFMSMLRFAKEENLDTKITLLYSSKDRESAAFLGELQKIANPNFKPVFTMTEDPKWEGEKGRVDTEFIKKYVEDLGSSVFYVAGPPAMTNAIVDALKELGIESSRIRYENFTGY